MHFCKPFLVIAILLLPTFSISSQSRCPQPDIEKGFGAYTSIAMDCDTIASKILPKESIYVFKPKELTGTRPCLFLYPKYNNNGPTEYEELISFLVSKKYVVLYPPYKPLNFRRKEIADYTITLDAFIETVEPVRTHIDTTRLGFIGHGFGAGNLPALVKLVVEKLHWGSQGIAMHLLSPWYFHGISKRELQTFAGPVHLIVQTYDNDNINDPRMGYTLFKEINIAPQNKEFYYLYSDFKIGCRLTADFATPLGREAMGGEVNIYDTYGIDRVLDAHLKAVFEKDPKAHTFAFGTGKERTLSMGAWPDGTPVKKMIATDNPEQLLVKKPYINMWTSIRNPYVELSTFRKAFKLYMSHNFRKVRNLTRFVIKSKKVENGELPPVEVFDNPIDSGYGSPGTFTMLIDSVANTVESPHPIYFFHPREKGGPLPLIILVHGYSGPDFRYFEPLIQHMVSKGHGVLFPTYPNLPLATSEKRVAEKIVIIKGGIEAGIAQFKEHMDTTKIACMGQSFGGGMVPMVSHMMLNEKKWGNKAAFLFIMAPWYCCGITPEELQSFPSHTKMVVQVYNDDMTNDHQIAAEMFNAISILKSEKDFITLNSDEFNGVSMQANHFVPYGTKNIYGEENLLDYYGVFRTFDALADYSFNANETAKCVALGDGCKEQTFMGEWAENRPFKPAKVSDEPLAKQSPFQYFYAWDNPLNPRAPLYTEEKKKGWRILKLKEKIRKLNKKD